MYELRIGNTIRNVKDRDEIKRLLESKEITTATKARLRDHKTWSSVGEVVFFWNAGPEPNKRGSPLGRRPELKKRWFGLEPRVTFFCPSCELHLVSPFSDVGTDDKCQRCGAHFIVPGFTIKSRWFARQEQARYVASSNVKKKVIESTTPEAENTLPQAHGCGCLLVILPWYGILLPWCFFGICTFIIDSSYHSDWPSWLRSLVFRAVIPTAMLLFGLVYQFPQQLALAMFGVDEEVHGENVSWSPDDGPIGYLVSLTKILLIGSALFIGLILMLLPAVSGAIMQVASMVALVAIIAAIFGPFIKALCSPDVSWKVHVTSYNTSFRSEGGTDNDGDGDDGDDGD